MESAVGEFKRLFPQYKIPIILAAVFTSGDSLKKKTDHDKEDWLTRRLYNRLIRKAPFRDGAYGLDIALQPEIVAEDIDADTPEGRIDIKVSCGRGYEVYFAIEAKRLRFLLPSGDFKTGSSEYVKDGMMRFVTGQYAPKMQAGGMLGYVFDGDASQARSGIEAAIENNAGLLRLETRTTLTPSKILPNKPVDETRHALADRFFIIYHIFFPV